MYIIFCFIRSITYFILFVNTYVNSTPVTSNKFEELLQVVIRFSSRVIMYFLNRYPDRYLVKFSVIIYHPT